ncbi:MAG: AAA family ATPase [Pseudomonadales bacterium]
MNSSVNPFTPGYGGRPPYIAGRESERALYAATLGTLAAGTLNSGIVMYGPRGMGKTTMLNWLEGQCREHGLTVTMTTPDENGGLAIEDFFDLLPDRLKLDQVSVDGNVGVDFGLKAQATFKALWSSSKRKKPQRLKDHLVDACKQGPRALLLDEAHTLNETVCRGLLNTAQSVMKDAPFLLVLSGTPGLVPLLREVEATFIERSEHMSIGRLAPDASADAICIPLRDAGIQIEPKALEQIIEDSQCYPYFLQLWGKALWDVAKKQGLQQLAHDDLSLAAPFIQKEKEGFYGRRYKALKKDKESLIAANAVGEAFKASAWQPIDEDKIQNVIEESLVDKVVDDDARNAKAVALADTLNDIDYIWDPSGTCRMEPGIPSFMTYVMEKVS